MRSLLSYSADDHEKEHNENTEGSTTPGHVAVQFFFSEKSSTRGSDDKNVLFTFFIETIHLTNEFIWSFACELITDRKIISKDIETHSC